MKRFPTTYDHNHQDVNDYEDIDYDHDYNYDKFESEINPESPPH